MSIEVSVTVILAMFTLSLVFTYAMGVIKPLGWKTILGNRESVPLIAGWPGRAQRAHTNALENLLPFAIVALALQMNNLSSALSQTAALVFLGARLVHGVTYVVGIRGVRTLSWNIGFAATVVAAIPLFSVMHL